MAETSRIISGGEIYLYGYIVPLAEPGFAEFDAVMVRDALATLSGDIVVNINSGGGSAFDGLAIHALLSAWPGKVTVRIHGLAASAATLVALAGDRIEMASPAFFMIHDSAGATFGGEREHLSAAGAFGKLDQTAAEMYVARTGIPIDDVRAMMDAETWMTAAEALEAGFVDAIIETPTAEMAAAFDPSLYRHPPASLAASPAARRRRPAAALPRSGIGSSDAAPAAMAATGQTEEISMTDTPAGGAQTPETKPAPIEMAHVDTTAAVRAERERTSGIAGAVRAAGLPAEFAIELASEGITLDAARARIIDRIAADRAADSGPEIVNARVTADGVDRFREGAERAVLAKAGLAGGERNEFSSLTLRELATLSLEVRNLRPAARTAAERISMAFVPAMAGGHSTSDFGSILGNVAEKAMLMGVEEAGETFQRWTSVGTLSDYKTTDRVDISAFPSLPAVPEGAEYQFATMSDWKEQVTLVKYGARFAITREAIINDDLGAFTRVPRKMGRAAIRSVGNLAYAVLTANAAMGDGTALFHANHANLAGSGAAPSVATFTAARVAMATQKDRSSNAVALNIRPAFFIGPVALEDTATKIVTSEHDPSGSARAANTARGMVEIIADARLDAASATAWYMAAAPGAADTVEISYLDGQTAPVLEQQDGWSIDGTEFKVRMDAAAKALAWEGLYKNPGA